MSTHHWLQLLKCAYLLFFYVLSESRLNTDSFSDSTRHFEDITWGGNDSIFSDILWTKRLINKENNHNNHNTVIGSHPAVMTHHVVVHTNVLSFDAVHNSCTKLIGLSSVLTISRVTSHPFAVYTNIRKMTLFNVMIFIQPRQPALQLI